MPLDAVPGRRLGASAAAVIVIVIAIVVVLGGSAAAGRGSRRPRLAVTSRSPVTVRGSRFVPRSRVSVTLVAATTVTRHPRTDDRGAFSVTFPAVIDRCTAWSVSAGQGPLRVVLHGAKPECPPA
ncbi:MAG: hypothetical protein WCB67_15355 [Solirubrobacteraceae bacterium]